MLAMQQLQPEMKKIQARYKDDRQKLNEEMLKFYKENDINPVAGCLPLLLQIPVFFFLYRTIIGLTHRAPYGYDMGAAVSRATSGATGTVRALRRASGSSSAISGPSIWTSRRTSMRAFTPPTRCNRGGWILPILPSRHSRMASAVLGPIS